MTATTSTPPRQHAPLHREPRHIGVLIVDCHLRDGRDGLALVAHIRELRLPIRTLVYSAFADGTLAAMAVVAGADAIRAGLEPAEQPIFGMLLHGVAQSAAALDYERPKRRPSLSAQ
jgi:ActR/RegA family two-component response regulator